MLKKTKITALILAILLLCSSVGTASACTPASEAEEEDPALACRSVIFQDKFEDGGVLLTLVHTLTVNDLSGFIYNSSKTITQNSLPDEAARIYTIGRLTKSGVSYGASNEIRTGLCYYNSSSDLFVPVYYRYVDSGVSFTENLCAVSSLSRYTTYYPFIKNMDADYGDVSGSVAFYYSTT